MPIHPPKPVQGLAQRVSRFSLAAGLAIASMMGGFVSLPGSIMDPPQPKDRDKLPLDLQAERIRKADEKRARKAAKLK